MMRTFHFLPPAPEEQKGFVIQFAGCIAGLILCGFLAWRAHDSGLRGVMIGAGVGVLFVLARSAWQLETKAQRAQNAEIGVDENGLRITNSKGETQVVAWSEIEKTEVVGGRLSVVWRGEELKFGSREMENGMELIELIAARGRSTPEAGSSSNFIPLSPK